MFVCTSHSNIVVVKPRAESALTLSWTTFGLCFKLSLVINMHQKAVNFVDCGTGQVRAALNNCAQGNINWPIPFKSFLSISQEPPTYTMINQCYGFVCFDLFLRWLPPTPNCLWHTSPKIIALLGKFTYAASYIAWKPRMFSIMLCL